MLAPDTRKRRSELEGWLRASTTEQRMAQRARIILLAANGKSSRAIAREVGMQPRIVSKWRMRFAADGIEALKDKARPGAKSVYGEGAGKRILSILDRPVPAGRARWTGDLVAAALGDVDVNYVRCFLRKQKIDLAGRKSWCESNDPDFAAKAADIVGLYLAPPENAIVICVDEKPSIQALERAQGYLKLPNGRCLTGHSHDYKRHGTTTLFAAFEVATGKVKIAHKKRRRRKEFLAFMDEVVAAWPKGQLNVILDNLNTHRRNEKWLARHPRVKIDANGPRLREVSSNGEAVRRMSRLAAAHRHRGIGFPKFWPARGEPLGNTYRAEYLRRRAPPATCDEVIKALAMAVHYALIYLECAGGDEYVSGSEVSLLHPDSKAVSVERFVEELEKTFEMPEAAEATPIPNGALSSSVH